MSPPRSANQLPELSEKDQARFWPKVALPNEQGCMLWTKRLDPNGYAHITISGRDEYAHRVSYVLAYGDIPSGLVVDHVKAKGCTNRHCVAPEHLEAVTQAENVRRGRANEWRKDQTHCPQDHSYSGDNLIIDGTTGARRCRTCRRAQARDKYRRQREAA